MKKMTLNELMKKIELLEIDDESIRNEIVCSLIGHSKIIHTCFGYIHCGRCDAQIGDALGGYFDASSYVIMRHKCETCFENFEKLTWRDTLFVENPFAEENEDGIENIEGSDEEDTDNDDQGDEN